RRLVVDDDLRRPLFEPVWGKWFVLGPTRKRRIPPTTHRGVDSKDVPEQDLGAFYRQVCDRLASELSDFGALGAKEPNEVRDEARLRKAPEFVKHRSHGVVVFEPH